MADQRPLTDGRLGAHWDGHNAHFSLFSAHATGVTLCLFDASGQREIARYPLSRDGDFWQRSVKNLRPHQCYGYRVEGPFDPTAGYYFNPHQLLLDPYARAVVGQFRWHPSHYCRHSDRLDRLQTLDSAPFSAKSQLIDERFNWEEDTPPRTPWTETVIYEVHLRGFTMQHPHIPEALRGTCAGFSHPEIVRYLKNLGVTAVEFLPLQYFIDEPFLTQKGLTNYWGYSPLNYFALQPRYLATQHPNEFKRLVKTLHRAGIEVIVDVVFNHTAEGGETGPNLCFRGIDNATYYRLAPHRGHYQDFSGCGNTFDLRHPAVLRMVMDSLRYWVTELHVDGFRFDLAPALARDPDHFHAHAPFLAAIYQDPILNQCKLIAEPWDLGPDGYCIGRFPWPWREWNGAFRDTVRDFWRGESHQLPQLAHRLSGSSDFYGHRQQATVSLNFVTAHDGFTLHDLVSYNEKHNENNGEANRDGESHNRSDNCGCEGPTSDELILTRRQRRQRNLLTTLFLAQGVPMLLFGDELSRSQQGNNNAYCQDQPLGWMPWSFTPEQRTLLEFTQQLIQLRHQHAVFRQTHFFKGQKNAKGYKDLAWMTPDGREMTPDDWHEGERQWVALWFNGQVLDDDDWFWMVNASMTTLEMTLPCVLKGQPQWRRILDTAQSDSIDLTGVTRISTPNYRLLPESTVLLRRSHKAVSRLSYQGFKGLFKP